MPQQDQLSKNDLVILMDSYKNNIQLNTTLLEQQKQMLQLHSNVIEKQNETINMLDNLIQKLGKCSETIGNNQTSLSSSLNQISNVLTTSLNDICHNLSADHQKIISKFNLTYVGFGSLIIAIIGMVIAFLEKMHPILNVIDKLGVK